MTHTLPNKSLGQHWLVDEAMLEAICEVAGVNAADTVLEIGPGPGALTEVLLHRASRVVAVEFDKELAESLARRLSSKNVAVESADFLKYDLNSLPGDYKVVANLPYYITSKIIRKLLESDNPPKTATLLVQKEVAERITAAPGAMSMLSVSAQFYSQPTLGPVVPAELFMPPPKVDSQVIHLAYAGPKFTDVLTQDFFRVVKAGFGERRKKLRSSLSGGLQISKEKVDELLKKIGIDPSARAQELSLDDWHNITKTFINNHS